jgi:hypothetical protein
VDVARPSASWYVDAAYELAKLLADVEAALCVLPLPLPPFFLNMEVRKPNMPPDDCFPFFSVSHSTLCVVFR